MVTSVLYLSFRSFPPVAQLPAAVAPVRASAFALATPRALDAPVTIATLPVRSAIVPSHWRYDGTSENSEPGPAAMVGYARMVSRSFGGHVRAGAPTCWRSTTAVRRRGSRHAPRQVLAPHCRCRGSTSRPVRVEP